MYGFVVVYCDYYHCKHDDIANKIDEEIKEKRYGNHIRVAVHKLLFKEVWCAESESVVQIHFVCFILRQSGCRRYILP